MNATLSFRRTNSTSNSSAAARTTTTVAAGRGVATVMDQCYRSFISDCVGRLERSGARGGSRPADAQRRAARALDEARRARADGGVRGADGRDALENVMTV